LVRRPKATVRKGFPGFREHVCRLELPDETELLLHGTILFVKSR